VQVFYHQLHRFTASVYICALRYVTVMSVVVVCVHAVAILSDNYKVSLPVGSFIMLTQPAQLTAHTHTPISDKP